MTKRSQRLLLIGLLALGAGSFQPAAAQTASRVSPLALQQWRLSQELGRYGLAQSDPHALLTAARLQRQSGLQPSRARVEGDKDAVPENADATTLLTQAKALAKDQPELLALIEESMAVRRRRGTVIGPQVQPLIMPPRDTRPIHLTYKPGQKAFFGVASDNMQDIAFSVQGPQDQPLCEPAQAAGEMVCEWVSGNPADVKVTVTNRSASAVMLTFFHD